MFNAVSLALSFLSLPLSISLSVYGSSLPFGIDLPLAANEKELCFLGLEAVGPSGFGSACNFWVLDSHAVSVLA